jgi:hypothetical protein
MKMEQIECSETSAYKIQTPGNHPEENIQQVWKNLRTAWVAEETTSIWYTVVHDIVATNERLYAIRLVESDRCRHCERRYTLIHRLTSCNEGMAIWCWTKERLAWLLRIDPRHIPDDWCLRPQFLTWPPQRHRAILWILAHFVSYRMQQWHLSLISTSCAVQDGSRTRRPAECSGWGTTFGYSRQ